MSENKTNSEQAAAEAGIKVSKPKEVPVIKEKNVISSPATGKKGGSKSGSLKPNNSGVLTSSKADRPSKTKPAAPKKEGKTVALFSTKNVRWPGVGELTKGYNIIESEFADQWLTRGHVRVATPEEVAAHFGR